MDIVQFQNNYMLGLAEECGWLGKKGYDAYSENGDDYSPELREAARKWWDAYNLRADSMEFAQHQRLYKALSSELDNDIGTPAHFSDGVTAYDIVFSEMAEGFFVILSDPQVIEFISDDEADDLPDLAAIQSFYVKFCNGGWEIVFEEIKEAE